MDILACISRFYGGEIRLHTPYQGAAHETIPREIDAILRLSDGISETMRLPDTNTPIEIGWIVYPHGMILEWTAFYRDQYGISGAVFSDDGADCVYCIQPDGTITCFDSTEREEMRIAGTLWDFFQSRGAEADG